MAPTNQVLVKESSHVRTITLNRPKQLNALSTEMLSRLFELFHAYGEDPNVKLIIMKGEGGNFCAGGDVAAVFQMIYKADWKLGAKVYEKAYTLNYMLATYNKPQVSLLRGIVMGGGAGASIHGRFRVATDTTAFAMPETAIGFFPDVGASYYLSRLPGFFGEYVGLTGARLDGAEMLACGLATHFVPLEKLSSLEEALCKANTSDPEIICNIINGFSYTPKLKENSQYFRLRTINECFSKGTVEEIISTLEKEANRKADQWISRTLKSLKKASPTSLKITFRSIREGRVQEVGQCLIREYRMLSHVLRGQITKDFSEGCRALLVDKDNNPKWKPSKLEFVSEHMVDNHFEPLDDEDWEDLKLPLRSNLPSHVISKL